MRRENGFLVHSYTDLTDLTLNIGFLPPLGFVPINCGHYWMVSGYHGDKDKPIIEPKGYSVVNADGPITMILHTQMVTDEPSQSAPNASVAMSRSQA